jgi:ADP-ribosylglycohydrolase
MFELSRGCERRAVHVEWGERTVRVRVTPEEEVCAEIVESQNGERDDHATFVELTKRLSALGFGIRACASCVRFRFSGMSHQFSGGRVGYCGLVGFRSRRGVVTVDHLCGEHEADTRWPEDVNAAFVARQRLQWSSRVEAFLGCMLGLAVGDALGFPAEFRRRAKILEVFPPDGLTGYVAQQDERWGRYPIILGPPHPPGTYSDDTQMTLAVADALLAVAGEADLEALMSTMASRFIVWSRAEDNDRAPGNACMTGCRALENGKPWREAGVAGSKGCGSAMRVAPVGLLYGCDLARLLEVARASSLLTHGHDAAVEGAAAAALLVALALEKKTPEEMFAGVVKECAPRSPDLRACFAKLPALIEAPPEVALAEGGLGEGWVAEEAVASALYCFWRSPFDFRRTVLTAANTDGDSDSIACIAGGISGAFNGVHAIDDDLRAGLENAAEIEDVARRLAALRGETAP